MNCQLRILRGDRSLRQVETETGIARGNLSRIERGREFPPDKHIAALEEAYGAPWRDWYPEHVCVELGPDKAVA